MIYQLLLASLLLGARACAENQVCPQSSTTQQRALADNLWAVQDLRKSLFSTLLEMRSGTKNSQTYFALSAVLDAIRRRHLDLYPALTLVKDLDKLPPQRQVDLLLQNLASQRWTGNAVEVIQSALRDKKLETTRNVTKGLERVRITGKSHCLDQVLAWIFRSIKFCPTPQALVGAVLANIPVRTRVQDARHDVCQLMRNQSLSASLWNKILDQVEIEGQTMQSWLAKIVHAISKFTSDVKATSELAEGILQLNHEKDSKWRFTGGRRFEMEEVATRLHPGKVLSAGFFAKPQEEEKSSPIGVERSPQEEDTYSPEIPVPGRMRRSTRMPLGSTTEASFGITADLKELSSAIANYTMSLMQKKASYEEPPTSAMPPIKNTEEKSDQQVEEDSQEIALKMFPQEAKTYLKEKMQEKTPDSLKYENSNKTTEVNFPRLAQTEPTPTTEEANLSKPTDKTISLLTPLNNLGTSRLNHSLPSNTDTESKTEVSLATTVSPASSQTIAQENAPTEAAPKNPGESTETTQIEDEDEISPQIENSQENPQNAQQEEYENDGLIFASQQKSSSSPILTRSLDRAIQRRVEQSALSPHRETILHFLPKTSKQDAKILKPLQDLFRENDHDVNLDTFTLFLIRANPPRTSILHTILQRYLYHISRVHKSKPKEQRDVRKFFIYLKNHPELYDSDEGEEQSIAQAVQKVQDNQDVPESVKRSLTAVRRWTGQRPRGQRDA